MFIEWKTKKVESLPQVKTSFFFNLYEIIDVNKTCCGNYFIIYISQIIMLYTLNAYNAVCTFYLN